MAMVVSINLGIKTLYVRLLTLGRCHRFICISLVCKTIFSECMFIHESVMPKLNSPSRRSFLQFIQQLPMFSLSVVTGFMQRSVSSLGHSSGSNEYTSAKVSRA